MCSLATSIFLNACKSWTLTAEPQRRIQAVEMRCYRKILLISYKDYLTNKKVCAKIQQAIGPHEDFLTIVKRRKLQWYGPVHQIWPKPFCKAQLKGEEDKAHRGRGGKTSGNGQAWSSAISRRQWRVGKNGGNWLRNHLWCPNDPRGKGIDDEMMMMKLLGNRSPEPAFVLYSQQRGRGTPLPRHEDTLQ